jgi:hypothetical protein
VGYLSWASESRCIKGDGQTVSASLTHLWFHKGYAPSMHCNNMNLETFACVGYKVLKLGDMESEV